jgi:hypothetical protein
MTREDQMHDIPFGMEVTGKSEKDWLRVEIDALRRSALLGYGALLAHNTDGRYDLVLAAMREPLFPGDKQPGHTG